MHYGILVSRMQEVIDVSHDLTADIQADLGTSSHVEGLEELAREVEVIRNGAQEHLNILEMLHNTPNFEHALTTRIHQVRTPLNTVLGYSRIYTEGLFPDLNFLSTKQLSYLTQISQLGSEQLQHLNTIIQAVNHAN